MAYNSYLIKINSATELPMTYMQAQTYVVTPQQRLEISAERDVTGVLHRNTAAHTPTKIEFKTPYLTNTQLASLVSLLTNGYTNALEKKIPLQYYDPITDSYLTGNFYVPDIALTIHKINSTTIIYEPVRIAFIEY